MMKAAPPMTDTPSVSSSGHWFAAHDLLASSTLVSDRTGTDCSGLFAFPGS
jgi:hypothetical protein